jgi:transcriptional regulator with XRE-family HTH domain
MAQVSSYNLRRDPSGPAYAALRKILVSGRKGLDLTQEQLAQRLGKPQSFVAKYERGERYIDAIELVALCQVLEIDMENVRTQISEHVL